MPMLKDPRWEAFAVARAGGAKLADAYLAAGYKASDARRAASNGSRLAARPEVKERIRELEEEVTARAVAESGVDKGYVLARAQEVVERGLQAKPVLNRHGQPTGEFRFDGPAVNGALRVLAESLGMTRKEIVHHLEGNTRTPDELARDAAAFIAESLRPEAVARRWLLTVLREHLSDQDLRDLALTRGFLPRDAPEGPTDGPELH